MASLLPFAAAAQMTALGKVNVFGLFHKDEYWPFLSDLLWAPQT
jgi:hypothetical protein